MNPTQTAQLQRRRAAHHAALGTLINADAAAGLKLWRKLRRIERQLYTICEHYIDGTNGIGQPQWDAAKDAARAQLLTLFGGSLPTGLYINGDPRGHKLKLGAGLPGVHIPDGMERDWGGNGILAADID